MTKRRRIGLWLVIASLLATSPAASADEVSYYDRFELWNGCKDVKLLVESLSDDAGEIALRKEDIETAVRSRLRGARIYDDRTSAYLYVNINVVGIAFNIDVQFNRGVEVVYPFWEKPEGIFPLAGHAPTWQWGSTGTHANDPSYILSAVARHTDKFIDEYLRVNADACE